MMVVAKWKLKTQESPVNAVCVVVVMVVVVFPDTRKVPTSDWTGDFLWTFPRFCEIHRTIRSWRNPKRIGKRKRKLIGKPVLIFLIMCHWPS